MYQSELLYLLAVEMLKQNLSCYPEGDHIWLAVDLYMDKLAPRASSECSGSFVVTANRLMFNEVNEIIDGNVFIIVFLQGTCNF